MQVEKNQMRKEIQRSAKLIVTISKLNLAGWRVPRPKFTYFVNARVTSHGTGIRVGARGWRTLVSLLQGAAAGTHDHREAHGRILLSPRRNIVGALGVVAVARLCLTLPRTTPRLRVLILISPFKFLRQSSTQANFPSARIVFRARVETVPRNTPLAEEERSSHFTP